MESIYASERENKLSVEKAGDSVRLLGGSGKREKVRKSEHRGGLNHDMRYECLRRV